MATDTKHLGDEDGDDEQGDGDDDGDDEQDDGEHDDDHVFQVQMATDTKHIVYVYYSSQSNTCFFMCVVRLFGDS